MNKFYKESAISIRLRSNLIPFRAGALPRWWRGLKHQALAATAAALLFSTAAAAAQTARSYGPIAAGETWQDVAAQVSELYPGLTQQQIARAIREANADQYGMGAQPTRGLAVLLPHPVVASQMLGLRPPAGQYLAGSQPLKASNPPIKAPADRTKQPSRTQIPEPPGKRRIQTTVLAPLPVPKSNAEAEYASLARFLDTHAGDPDFDYRFGVAALDSGEYSQAVLALQRVVWSDPDFAGARFDLARAHIALGDLETARVELNRVQRSNPPPTVQNAVTAYLARIDQLAAGQGAQQEQLKATLGLVAGYDDNANAATADTEFLGIPLDTDSRTTDSPYYGLFGDLRYAAPIAENAGLTARLEGRAQEFPDASFVDSTDIRGSVGLNTARGDWRWSTSIGGHFATIDNSYNNRGVRVEAGLAYVAPRFRVDFTGRAGLLRFPDRLAVQSVDQTAGGLTLSLLPTPRSLISITGLLGEDEAEQAGSPYSRDLAGGRIRFNQIIGSHELRLSANYLDSDFDGQFFGTLRTDEQTSAAIAFFYRGLPGRLTLVPRVRYIDNESNVGIFDYDRTDASLTLQHDF